MDSYPCPCNHKSEITPANGYLCRLQRHWACTRCITKEGRCQYHTESKVVFVGPMWRADTSVSSSSPACCMTTAKYIHVKERKWICKAHADPKTCVPIPPPVGHKYQYRWMPTRRLAMLTETGPATFPKLDLACRKLPWTGEHETNTVGTYHFGICNKIQFCIQIDPTMKITTTIDWFWADRVCKLKIILGGICAKKHIVKLDPRNRVPHQSFQLEGCKDILPGHWAVPIKVTLI